LRKNPFRLLNCVAKSLLTALGTASRWVIDVNSSHYNVLKYHSNGQAAFNYSSLKYCGYEHS
jgi:hypothetical protein